MATQSDEPAQPTPSANTEGAVIRPRDSYEWLGWNHENRMCDTKSDVKSYVWHVDRVTRTRHSYDWLGVNNQWDDSTEFNFDLLILICKTLASNFVEFYRVNVDCLPTTTCDMFSYDDSYETLVRVTRTRHSYVWHPLENVHITEADQIIVNELLTYVSDKINSLPYDMIVKGQQMAKVPCHTPNTVYTK